MDKDKELAQLKRQIASINTILDGMQSKSLEKCIEAGVLLCEIRDKKLVPYREFGTWCDRNVGIGKSQRSVYMTVARHRERLAELKAWGLQNQHEASTISDIYHLIKAKEKNKAPARSVSITEISDAQKRLYICIFDLWAHPTTTRNEADNAELKLHRAADKHDLKTRQLIKVLGLKVPPHRNLGYKEDEATDLLAA